MSSNESPMSDPKVVNTDPEQPLQSQSNAPTSKDQPDSIPAFKALSFLDRYLAVWILLSMVIGVIIGNFSDVAPALEKGKFVGVSIPIAIGLLVMMYPILCKVQYETLHLLFRSKDLWKQIGFSLIMNWVVAPLYMLGLAWAFLPDEKGLRNGLILVGLGRCIAMVLIWNALASGDADYCAILVVVNSILQIVLFAPLAVLFIRVIGQGSEFELSYETVATNVAVFLGIPLGVAVITRLSLRNLAGPKWYDNTFIKYLSPLSLIGLLYTIIILFASQGRRVVHQVVSVTRVAAPLIVYFVVIFLATLFICRRLGYGYSMSVTQSFTAASNNFELAIAVAVATFGVDSDEALAATVGPLVEVPVLIGLVYVVKFIARRSKWII